MEKNMAEEKFLIENYGKKGTFASFLPGISGEKGIPIWCYYVNRGQCVVSFGKILIAYRVGIIMRS